MLSVVDVDVGAASPVVQGREPEFAAGVPAGGRNGRGKTSLLRLAAVWPRRSPAACCGRHAVRKAPAFTRALVFIGHANALKDDHGDRGAAVPCAIARPRSLLGATLDDALQRLGMATRRDTFVRTLSRPAPPAYWHGWRSACRIVVDP
jgi:ABC-type transport system involved in cytochrome c biogenesis ATPase subunit